MNKHIKFFSVILLSFGLILIVNYYSSGKVSNPAMMGETFDVIARNINGEQIHLIEIELESINKIISTVNDNKETVFVLGNSQTQSINQLKEKQSNLVELISNKMTEFNIISHTMPNMNLQEFWLSLNYWNSKVSIDKLVVPIFFDDFRENQTRDQLIEFLADENFRINQKDIISSKIDSAINNHFESEINLNIGQVLEKNILKFLNENFLIWENRSNIKSNIHVALYNLRNTIFNIKPTSKRKVIKSSFKNNMTSLINILKFTKNKEIETYLYIPPIRQDYEIPYDKLEYLSFKKMIKDSTKKYGGKFKNFEKIIPPSYWGNKQSTNLYETTEIDFMHFRYEGHKILSDSLSKFIK